MNIGLMNIDITALSDLFDRACRLQDDLQDYLLGTRPASVFILLFYCYYHTFDLLLCNE
jgi:uncharacterized membrane protein (Fun14 family)